MRTTIILLLAVAVGGCRTATLVVRAQDGATGAPVPRPEVTVAPGARSRASDGAGDVRLDGLRARRTYTVTVRGAGYGQTSRAVRLCAGRTDTLVVPLAPASQCDLACVRHLEPPYERPCTGDGR